MWTGFGAFLINLIGFALAVALAGAVIYWIRKPMENLLTHIIKDQEWVKPGVSFVLILLGLQGLRTALSFVSQPNLSRLVDSLSSLLIQLAGELQWAVYIAVLLFIAYSIRGRGKQE